MMGFFRNKFTIYLLSSLLFLGFSLKANSYFGQKWLNAVCELEEKQLSEEEKGAKDEKPNRHIKKNWDYSSNNHHFQTNFREPKAKEAHNRVYLLAIISAPLIPIQIEPPNFAKSISLA